MRFYCDVPGLTDNWVEVSEVWRRDEAMKIRTGMEDFNADDFWDFWSSKVESCHIISTDGTVASTPAEIDDEFLAMLDFRLSSFLGGVLFKATNELMRLGNRAGRLSGSA